VFSPSFLGFYPLIIIRPLLHTHLTPPPQVSNIPDQRASHHRHLRWEPHFRTGTGWLRTKYLSIFSLTIWHKDYLRWEPHFRTGTGWLRTKYLSIFSLRIWHKGYLRWEPHFRPGTGWLRTKYLSLFSSTIWHKVYIFGLPLTSMIMWSNHNDECYDLPHVLSYILKLIEHRLSCMKLSTVFLTPSRQIPENFLD
jgi:hypothetical protein